MQNRETSSPLQGVQHQVVPHEHDPRTELFWLNGARIIANEMQSWVIGIDKKDLHIESAEVKAISSQYANRVLGFLEGSRVYQGQNPLIYIEKAMILWR